MNKIAVLHTTPATVPVFQKLIGDEIPEATVENFVDDSILPMLMADGESLGYAFEKLLCYAKFAERQGAAVILSACSSVGEFVPWAQPQLQVPLLRIDDPAAALAVKRGRKIAVLATLPTTLAPSCRLLSEKKADVEVVPMLVEDAYEALRAGDSARHDALIAKAACEAAERCDIIFLAQASMARAAQTTAQHVQQKILYSTRPAVEALIELWRQNKDAVAK